MLFKKWSGSAQTEKCQRARSIGRKTRQAVLLNCQPAAKRKEGHPCNTWSMHCPCLAFSIGVSPQSVPHKKWMGPDSRGASCCSRPAHAAISSGGSSLPDGVVVAFSQLLGTSPWGARNACCELQPQLERHLPSCAIQRLRPNRPVRRAVPAMHAHIMQVGCRHLQADGQHLPHSTYGGKEADGQIDKVSSCAGVHNAMARPQAGPLHPPINTSQASLQERTMSARTCAHLAAALSAPDPSAPSRAQVHLR